MRDFPQELVDEAAGRLFDLVGRGHYYRGPSTCPRDFSRVVNGVSDYSLVSRAWVVPTQKHHFNFLNLDHPSKMEKWCACFEPDPNGILCYVRRLFLQAVELPYFEGFKEHLLAFT